MAAGAKFIAGTVALLVMGACGQRTDVVPVTGQNLPPAPYAQETQPDSAELLVMETLAAPERSVELRRRSEERKDDPFDLPPE